MNKKHQLNIRTHFTLFVIFAFALQFGVAPAFRVMAADGDPSSHLIYKKGQDVTVNGKKAANGMEVKSGDLIETQSGTEIEIQSVGDSSIKIFQNARLTYNYTDERVDVSVHKGCATLFLDPVLQGSLTLPKGAKQEFKSGENSFLTSCGIINAVQDDDDCDSDRDGIKNKDDDDCDGDGIKNDVDDDNDCRCGGGGFFSNPAWVGVLVGSGIATGLIIYFASQDDTKVISPSIP